MTTSRNLVLKNLLNRHYCTINDLAEAVEINPISIRHHITKLEAEGLVSSKEERHGVGRPRRIYFLTEAGMEQFPTRYLNLSNRLVEQLKETLPEDILVKIFSQMGIALAKEHNAGIDMESLTYKERLILAEKNLRSEGFTTEVSEEDWGYKFSETSCPFFHIAQEHREVCIIDRTLITETIGTPVEQTQCMVEGHSSCTFEAPFLPATEINVTEINA